LPSEIKTAARVKLNKRVFILTSLTSDVPLAANIQTDGGLSLLPIAQLPPGDWYAYMTA
jgi:hypothetical protein